MTIPFGGIPLREGLDRRAGRPGLHRRLVGRGQRGRCLARPSPSPRCGRRPCAWARPSCPPSRGSRLPRRQSAGSLAQAAPGRFALGIGTSSNVIVEGWNGIPFDQPYQKTRDMVRFLRQALTGEKVTAEYETFKVRSFKLGVVPEQPVPILVAALREGAAPRRARGRRRDRQLAVGRRRGDRCPDRAQGRGRRAARDRGPHLRGPHRRRGRRAGHGPLRHRRAHLNVPVYAAFHEWLSRGEALGEMWRLWRRAIAGGARRHPRLGGRRAHRLGPARAVPRAPRPLRGERRDDPGDRAAALRLRRAPGGARPGTPVMSRGAAP